MCPQTLPTPTYHLAAFLSTANQETGRVARGLCTSLATRKGWSIWVGTPMVHLLLSHFSQSVGSPRANVLWRQLPFFRVWPVSGPYTHGVMLGDMDGNRKRTPRHLQHQNRVATSAAVAEDPRVPFPVYHPGRRGKQGILDQVPCLTSSSSICLVLLLFLPPE